MTISPITDTVPACYGICCERRAECARYAAVEVTIEPLTIATCDSGRGQRPRFVALHAAEAAEA